MPQTIIDEQEGTIARDEPIGQEEQPHVIEIIKPDDTEMKGSGEYTMPLPDYLSFEAKQVVKVAQKAFDNEIVKNKDETTTEGILIFKLNLNLKVLMRVCVVFVLVPIVVGVFVRSNPVSSILACPIFRCVGLEVKTPFDHFRYKHRIVHALFE